MEQKIRILLVDDEEFNLKALSLDLSDNGYEIVKAQDGQIACNILKQDPNFRVILLDRMMPNMDGMQALSFIKSEPTLKNIPVIMQTAAASTKEILEGINAGVFYYLTKPYEVKVLLAIVKSALSDSSSQTHQLDKLVTAYKGLSLIETGAFKFRTMEDAANLSEVIAQICPRPEETFVGISAIILNAIEHGNLGITFKEKTDMMLANVWTQEIEKRLKHKSYIDKYASLTCVKTKDLIEITVEDMGNGFDWKEFIDLNPARALLPNGRGIAMAKMISFHTLEFMEKGNKVVGTIKL